MTDAEFQAWLDGDDAFRVVLVEARARDGTSGAEITRYLASVGYVTRPADTPSSTPYLPLIAGGISVKEEMGLDRNGTMTLGDIELHNEDGRLDHWLNDVWSNRPVAAFVGDMRWPRGDFRMIFNGVCAGIDSREPGRLNLKLRDKMQRLNHPLTELKLGGTGPNADRLVPLTFGEPHNITPLLVSEGALRYQYQQAVAEGVVEVRDNGIPVNVQQDRFGGTFTLTAQPAGTITATVQGHATPNYSPDPLTIIERVVQFFGKSSEILHQADIDTAAFNALRPQLQQVIGVYVDTRRTVLDLVNEIADSVGVRLVMNRVGQLRPIRVAIPPPGVPRIVRPYNMVADSLRIVERPAIGAAAKVGYAKNWTIQEALQTRIPAAHKEMFGEEWLTATASNSGVATLHAITGEPEIEPTLLVRKSDAQAEANRRLALRSVQRTVFEFDAYSELMGVQLGDPLTLVHPRFGLANGRTGQVISVSIDWLKCRVKVGVII